MSVSEEAELLEEKVYRAGSHVMLFYKQRIAVSAADNPAFNNQAITFITVTDYLMYPARCCATFFHLSTRVLRVNFYTLIP